MWDLQGILLYGVSVYRSIEHRNERQPERIRENGTLVPYADILPDPFVDPEYAKKLAA